MNTDKQKLQDAVEVRLKSRLETLGIKPVSAKGRAEQAAFIAGAATALHAVFAEEGTDRLTDYVPPKWVIYPLSGRSII